MTSIDYDTAFDILLPTTIAVSVVFLIIVPAIICFVFHRNEKRRLRQAGGDVFALRMAPPSFSTKELLLAWAQSAVFVVMGMFLLTVYAAQSSNLETSYDYYGPMHVREYTIETKEAWKSSGLTRQWSVQALPVIQVEWSTSSSDQDDSSLCRTQALYRQCLSGGLACDSKPCSSEEVTLEENRANECIQRALDRENEGTTSTALDMFQMLDDEAHSFGVNATTDTQDLPTLSFYGNAETCFVRSASEAQTSSLESRAYLGGTFVGLGLLVLMLNGLVFYTRHVTQRDAPNGNSDGNTECSGSVASLDEKDLDKDDGREEAILEATENESSASSFPSTRHRRGVSGTSTLYSLTLDDIEEDQPHSFNLDDIEADRWSENPTTSR